MTREEKMRKRRELGKIYKYEPIPYEKGSDEYYEELINRADKNISHKLPFAEWTSVIAKLDNELLKEKMKKKNSKKVS